MASIWQTDGTKWTLLSPQGYPNEQTLHDLIEDAPHMLPLSGEPRVVIVGKEVVLSGNYADLLGVEPDGRLVLIEIKLKKNAEARRAVVAQILTYAASLAELDRHYIEQSLISGYLAKDGFTTIAEAVAEKIKLGNSWPSSSMKMWIEGFEKGHSAWCSCLTRLLWNWSSSLDILNR